MTKQTKPSDYAYQIDFPAERRPPRDSVEIGTIVWTILTIEEYLNAAEANEFPADPNGKCITDPGHILSVLQEKLTAGERHTHAMVQMYANTTTGENGYWILGPIWR